MLFFYGASVWAQEDSKLHEQDQTEWKERTNQVHLLRREGLTDETFCSRKWDLTWPLVKKGNLRARISLLMQVADYGKQLPGRSGDKISQLRDVTILAVHTSGFHADRAKNYSIGALYYLYETLPFEQLGGKKFLDCVSKNWSRSCAQVAVETGLVLSFEEFANEIDQQIALGIVPTCPDPPPAHLPDTGPRHFIDRYAVYTKKMEIRKTRKEE